MIEPAVTTWPPYAFTPRYCGLESRPLRLEPPPFLCAISHLFFCRYAILHKTKIAARLFARGGENSGKRGGTQVAGRGYRDATIHWLCSMIRPSGRNERYHPGLMI